MMDFEENIFHLQTFFQMWYDKEKTKKNLRKGSRDRTGNKIKWNRLGQGGVRGTGGTGTGGSSYWVEQS